MFGKLLICKEFFSGAVKDVIPWRDDILNWDIAFDFLQK
jgi:hypothetical protein